MPRGGKGDIGYDTTRLTDDDLHLFNEGTHLRLADVLGAHLMDAGGVRGTYFAVWAPDAEAVSVTGDFNGWRPRRDPLRPRGTSGIWEGFLPGVGDRKSTRLNSSHGYISYAVFCFKKKK